VNDFSKAFLSLSITHDSFFGFVGYKIESLRTKIEKREDKTAAAAATRQNKLTIS
jgi:hypothetical protein